MPPLTDQQIKAAKPRKAQHKLYDEDGMYVLVHPNGSKYFRLKYRIQNREKVLALGVYPATSLKQAREERDDARKLVKKGIDPTAQRQAEKLTHADTFKVIAEEWLAKQTTTLAEETLSLARGRLDAYVYPHIGNKPIRSLSAPEVLALLRKIETKGHHETAHRVKALCGRIFRYAIATGHADRDPSADLKGALTPVSAENFAAITEPKRVGELLRAIDGYQGQPQVLAALKLAPLVFVRPGELRAAEWGEFTLEGERPEWRIPAERMKMGEQHIVPLSTQAVAILTGLQPITGARRLVFPSVTHSDRPLSDNTLNAALRRMGFTNEEMTAHGFRSMASTLLNEQGWNADWVEAQLSHGERDKVRGAYNHAKYLADRRRMMQAWADYLDVLRVGGADNVVAIRKPSGSAA